MIVNNFWLKHAVVLVITVIVNTNLTIGFSLTDVFGVNAGELLNTLFGSNQDNNSAITSKIRMEIYNRSCANNLTTVDIPVDQPESIYEHIDPSQTLVVYIHGFREHPSNESVRTVAGSYLEHTKQTIMTLDWSDLAFDNYVTVSYKAKGIAKVLAKTLDQLTQLGLDPQMIHLIGHSLGAQIAGYAGQMTNYTIPRITGLDPAGPGFYIFGSKHIDVTSAQFVDIIHTDKGIYGASENTGTVDFYANSGKRLQPGCPLFGMLLSPADLCSHWRSWQIYAESLKNTYAFPAIKCPSHADFTSGKCRDNHITFVGYAADNTTRGSYYFITNDSPPYGKGSRNNTGFIRKIGL